MQNAKKYINIIQINNKCKSHEDTSRTHITFITNKKNYTAPEENEAYF